MTWASLREELQQLPEFLSGYGGAFVVAGVGRWFYPDVSWQSQVIAGLGVYLLAMIAHVYRGVRSAQKR